MITIEILNPEEVAQAHTGKFTQKLIALSGVNLKKRIESNMAKRLKKELAKSGMKTRITVT